MARLRIVGESDRWDVRVRDLGLGGACVEAAAPVGEVLARLGAETALSIEVTAPTLWDPLHLPGKFVWRSAASGVVRVGLAFEHRDPSALYALAQLLGTQGYEEP